MNKKAVNKFYKSAYRPCNTICFALILQQQIIKTNHHADNRPKQAEHNHQPVHGRNARQGIPAQPTAVPQQHYARGRDDGIRDKQDAQL